MRTRAVAMLLVVLAALAFTPSFEAMPKGIGSAADGGCSCHGGANADTTVVVTGLPESFNASETYTFTVTVVNDDLPRSVDANGGNNGQYGGYRILVNEGAVSPVPESAGQIMDAGLTHTEEA
ncbi:MAG: hypothetical protein ACPHX2_02155, partial [Candidatus Poseidoniaceae archaeon]